MTDAEGLIADLRQFVAERDWSQFHDPKNLVMLLASEVGELVAEYRWVAGAAADAHSREQGAARERIIDEVGDVGIALLLLCDRTGIDLREAVAWRSSRRIAGGIRWKRRAGKRERPEG